MARVRWQAVQNEMKLCVQSYDLLFYEKNGGKKTKL